MANSSLQPLILHAAPRGPNPWKVAIILKELDIPYKTVIYDFPDLKKEPFITFNPNGRAPALQDPNTGVTLGESGAIIQYLIETYDKSNKLHYTTSPEKYQCYQWLHFQMSGQGPYFGQFSWFKLFHAEKVPSAEERYANEIKRVLGVVDAHLKKQRTSYLVGDKCTYADLAWIPWDRSLSFTMPEVDFEKEFPLYSAWNQRLLERPEVKKVLDEMDAERRKRH